MKQNCHVVSMAAISFSAIAELYIASYTWTKINKKGEVYPNFWMVKNYSDIKHTIITCSDE